MSIIKGLRAATARSPTVSKAVTVSSLTTSGGLAAGEDPQSAARKLSTVDRCIEILSDSIAKLPNYVIDTRTRERTGHELLRLLNIRPNEAMTPFIRKKVLETSRLEGGNGYDWIVRDERTGKPVELIPVPWYLVQPWHDLAGRVWYDVTHPFTGEVMRLPNEDVCHYKNATRNGLIGLGTVTRAGEVIASARAAQEYELSYDAMLKAEETWLDSSYDAKTWPMPAATAVADIAARMGVAVDSRTVLDAAFPVQYPVDSDGDMTMREALSRVAVANAGNWIITDEGKLLLVGLNSMPAETNYLITEGGNAITFGGVRILV